MCVRTKRQWVMVIGILFVVAFFGYCFAAKKVVATKARRTRIAKTIQTRKVPSWQQRREQLLQQQYGTHMPTPKKKYRKKVQKEGPQKKAPLSKESIAIAKKTTAAQKKKAAAAVPKKQVITEPKKGKKVVTTTSQPSVATPLTPVVTEQAPTSVTAPVSLVSGQTETPPATQAITEETTGITTAPSAVETTAPAIIETIPITVGETEPPVESVSTDSSTEEELAIDLPTEPVTEVNVPATEITDNGDFVCSNKKVSTLT